MIIFQNGNEFWIEIHFVGHGSVAAVTTDTVVVALDRAGDFIGGCATLQRHAEGTASLLNGSSAILTFGQAITSFASIVFNADAGSARVMDSLVILFMRGRAV